MYVGTSSVYTTIWKAHMITIKIPVMIVRSSEKDHVLDDCRVCGCPLITRPKGHGNYRLDDDILNRMKAVGAKARGEYARVLLFKDACTDLKYIRGRENDLVIKTFCTDKLCVDCVAVEALSWATCPYCNHVRPELEIVYTQDHLDITGHGDYETFVTLLCCRVCAEDITINHIWSKLRGE